MKNPYGLTPAGRVVSVFEVDRGLACDCVCPSCGHQLEAHKGSIKEHYFAHYRGSDCGNAYETALHILAKEVLATKKRLLLPELTVHSDISIAKVGTQLETAVLVKPWTRINFEEVILEKPGGKLVPDVLLTKAGRPLIVEIRVTHKVDPKKLAKIVVRGIGAIEYDFSAANRYLTRIDLQRVLIETYAKRGLGRGTWIYHPKSEKAIRELNARYRAKH